MPSSLHQDLVEAAAAEEVSLNMFICTTLARVLDWEARDMPAREVRMVRGDIARNLWSERHAVDEDGG